MNNKAIGEGLNQRNSLLLPAGLMEPLVRVFVFIGERISGQKILLGMMSPRCLGHSFVALPESG